MPTRTCFALVSREMLWYLNNTCHRLISCREQLPNGLSITACQSKKCFAIMLFLFGTGWCLWEMRSYVIAVRLTWEEFCLISHQCDCQLTDSLLWELTQLLEEWEKYVLYCYCYCVMFGYIEAAVHSFCLYYSISSSLFET